MKDVTIKGERFDDTISVEFCDSDGSVWLKITDCCFDQDYATITTNFTAAEIEQLVAALTQGKKAEAPKKRKAPHGPQEYKGNGKHSWEDVVPSVVQRLRVPGGWLYSGDRCTLTFVPVPEAVGYAV